jgi:Domain of unknown function (DUF1906)
MTASQPPNTFGFDASVDCSPVMAGLTAAGDKFIMRYAGTMDAWAGKIITPAEAVLASLLGIGVVPIWESSAQRSLQGNSAGQEDGANLQAYLPKIGLMPTTGVIAYATSDFDSLESQYPAVSAYYQGFGTALGVGYDVGAYANGYTANRLKQDGIIVSRWVTQSMGFTDTEQDLAAGEFEIAQRLPVNASINGAVINIDPDSLIAPTTDIGARVPWGSMVPQGASFNAGAIQFLLNKIGQSPPLGMDDALGNLTNTALKAWLAKNNFPALAWGGAIEALLQQAGISIYEGTAPAVMS